MVTYFYDNICPPNVNYDLSILASTAATPWKEVIGTQKWISLYHRGMEAWTFNGLSAYGHSCGCCFRFSK